MVIKVIIRKVCNLIQWQFRRRNYNNEFKEIHFDALNALEKNSYFIYKNFLPISQIQKLKKKHKQYKKKNKSNKINTVYFRSRTDVSIDNNFINIYVKNNYVKKILNNFYGIPTEIEKCTYELKKGLKKKNYLYVEYIFFVVFLHKFIIIILFATTFGIMSRNFVS